MSRLLLWIAAVFVPCCGAAGKFAGAGPAVAEVSPSPSANSGSETEISFAVDTEAEDQQRTIEQFDAQETVKPLDIAPASGGPASVRGNSGGGGVIRCCHTDIVARHQDTFRMVSPFKEAWVERTVAQGHVHTAGKDEGEKWPVQVVMNPGGYRFGIFTVHNASALALDSRPPSLDSTWFPGFAWTPVVCARCGVFVGWFFEKMAPQDVSPEYAHLDSFYGLIWSELVRGAAQQAGSPGVSTE